MKKTCELLPQYGGRKPARAFSLIEAMVVVGILAVLLGLLLPAIRPVQWNARNVTAMSAIRQLGQEVLAYAGDNKDEPPVLWDPLYVNPMIGHMWQEKVIRGNSLKGAWFQNTLQYYMAFSTPPPSVLTYAPGAKPPSRLLVSIDSVSTGYSTDYQLSECFYADPEYWDRFSQAGPTQWHVQKVSSTVFPSSKGMMLQTRRYDVPGWPKGYEVGAAEGINGAVLWCDLSASVEIAGKLRPGVPNGWHEGVMPPVWVNMPGRAVIQTANGLRGRDR